MTDKSNKTTIIKGVKFLVVCLIFMFVGPALLYIAFGNTQKTHYYPTLILGVISCLLAVFLLYIGVKTIVKGLFGEE